MTNSTTLVFLLSIVGCAGGNSTTQPIAPAGVYIQCGAVFSGMTLEFLHDHQLKLNVFSDDGPWELELTGQFQIEAGRISASHFELTSIEGPAPRIDSDFEVVLRAFENAQNSKLEIVEISGAPLGDPWLEPGNRYAKSQDLCD